MEYVKKQSSIYYLFNNYYLVVKLSHKAVFKFCKVDHMNICEWFWMTIARDVNKGARRYSVISFTTNYSYKFKIITGGVNYENEGI